MSVSRRSREGPRIVFAGDRDVSVWVLDFMLRQGVRPVALWVPPAWDATHANHLLRRCSNLAPAHISHGHHFRTDEHVEILHTLQPDYILSVHFPLIIPDEVLAVPRHGALNLHPAYLPYNRGWHTPSWAILDGTPFGATLHFMAEEVDAGDIILQKRIEVQPDDTADTLYQRVKRVELDVLEEVWPRLVTYTLPRRPQNVNDGTVHQHRDLVSRKVQRIDPDERIRAGKLIDRLRALTTDRPHEAAFLEVDGRRCRLRLEILPDDNHRSS